MTAPHIFATVFFLACFAESSVCQTRTSLGDMEQRVTVRGNILHPPGTVIGNLMLELYDPMRHSSAVRTLAASNGDFEFQSVAPGSYTLRITTVAGAVIVEQYVDVHDDFSRIEVKLPVDSGSKPGAGTVSLAQLRHRVPSKAMKQYETARKAMAKKNVDLAIEHFENAVEIDPDFAEAQSDLARCYLEKHEPAKVVEAFRHVLKINPRSEIAYAGTSLALLWMNQAADAEKAARQALEINSGSQTCLYFLGMSLAAQAKDEDEALRDLEKTAAAYPSARLAAAQILARRGNSDQARMQLEGYLQSGRPEHRDQVKLWLDRLKQR